VENFISEMLALGAELEKANSLIEISIILNDAEILYKNHFIKYTNNSVVIVCKNCRDRLVKYEGDWCDDCLREGF
jgi:hypothetical protein